MPLCRCGCQGIRVLAKFHDVISFGPKNNYDLTTLTLSQQPFSSHIFFARASWAFSSHNFFRQNQAKGRVIIFSHVSSHNFWQHSASARNTAVKKNSVQSAYCQPGPVSSHIFFARTSLALSSHNLFRTDTASLGRVIFRANTLSTC